MYKFSRLRTALNSPLVWSPLAFSLAFLVSPVRAETPTTAPKATTAQTAVTTQATASTQPAATAPPTGAQSTAGGTAIAPETRSIEPSAAQRDQARLAFEAGTKAFNQSEFTLAVQEFEKAQALLPSPHAEYWIAVAKDKADPETKDPKAIAFAYETFLTNPGADHVGAAQVGGSKLRLAELRKMLPATVTIVSDPAGASVTINGEAQPGVTPMTVELPSGVYQVGLSLVGYDNSKVELNAEGGISLEQQIKLAPTAVAPPVAAATVAATPVQPEPQTKSMVPAIVTLSLGGAGLISGTIFGIMALGAKSKFNDDPTAEHADAAERNALIADMSFGIAITLGLTGIVLLTSDDGGDATTAKKKQGKHSEFAFAPYASPYGAGATARLKF